MLAAWAGGCGGNGAGDGTWLSLARGYEAPGPARAVAAWKGPGGAGYELSPEETGSGYWIERKLPRTSWRREEKRAGFWSIDRPMLGLTGTSPVASARLHGEGKDLELTTPRDVEALVATGSPAFFLMPRRVVVALPDGVEMPDELVYGVLCDPGTSRDGVWRARSGLLTADGLSLWSGQEAERHAVVPPASRLSFSTAARGVEAGARLRFRIRLDGEVVFEHEQDTSSDETIAHVVALPPTGATGASLVFEVSGDPGLGTFVAPLVGPVASGTAGRRPDVVLFLADTFRADNLRAYGGGEGRAPALDRFADECVRFHRTRSPASWTLPAISSVLSGLYPPQHGAQVESMSMSGDIVTLAEVLARHGYRTGAVTDSGFVTAYYAMDQGFEVFQERAATEWDLRRTFAWALDFLARDDGRPAFLFVHTYRTHYPYRQGVEEDYSAWIEALKHAGIEDWKTGRPAEEVMPYASEFRELYRDGVAALDQQFGPWWEELERRGWADRGYLIMTSDHGEAFGEHVEFGHGGQLWDEKIRVPLLFHGPGLTPRDEELGASLVDVSPTVAVLAGIPAPQPWEGQSLFALDGDRPLLSFNAGVGGEHLSLVTGSHKVLAAPSSESLERGEYDAAFDLGADPGEQRDLKGEAPEWAGRACRSVSRLVEELLRPVAQARGASVSGEKNAELRNLGYGGD